MTEEEQEVNLVIDRASSAFHSFCKESIRFRRLVLKCICERIADELDIFEGCQNEQHQLFLAIQAIRFYSDWKGNEAIQGHLNLTSNNTQNITYTVFAPVGVLGAILSRKSTYFDFAMVIAPVIACGNTVVMKVSDSNANAAQHFCKMLREVTQLPEGVVNLVIGGGAVSESCLASHIKISKVIFAGSLRVGSFVFDKCSLSRPLKPVSFLLNYSAPALVLSDADIDHAVTTLVSSVFGDNTGGGERLVVDRVYVQREVLQVFAEQLVARLRSLSCGERMDTCERIIDPKDVFKTVTYIQYHTSRGAKILIGREQKQDSTAQQSSASGTNLDGHVVEPVELTPTEFASPSTAPTPMLSADIKAGAAMQNGDPAVGGGMAIGVETGAAVETTTITVTPPSDTAGSTPEDVQMEDVHQYSRSQTPGPTLDLSQFAPKTPHNTPVTSFPTLSEQVSEHVLEQGVIVEETSSSVALPMDGIDSDATSGLNNAPPTEFDNTAVMPSEMMDVEVESSHSKEPHSERHTQCPQHSPEMDTTRVVESESDHALPSNVNRTTHSAQMQESCIAPTVLLSTFTSEENEELEKEVNQECGAVNSATRGGKMRDRLLRECEVLDEITGPILHIIAADSVAELCMAASAQTKHLHQQYTVVFTNSHNVSPVQFTHTFDAQTVLLNDVRVDLATHIHDSAVLEFFTTKKTVLWTSPTTAASAAIATAPSSANGEQNSSTVDISDTGGIVSSGPSPNDSTQD